MIHNYYGGSGPAYNGPARRRASLFSQLLTLVVCVVIGLVLLSIVTGSVNTGGVPRSTMNREKLDVNFSYQNDCVWDEMNWVNTSRVSRDMKPFYEKTGIQPALAIFDYIPDVTGDDEASEAYAAEWYDTHIEGEGTLLLAYFDTGTEEEGWAYLVYGDLTKSVMDAEAEEIFWAYYDRYWTDNSISLDDAYPAMFVKTADRIMQKTTTGMDVLKIVFTGSIIVVVVSGILIIMNVRRKHEAEKAEETERILSTPLERSTDSEIDRLAEQYNNDSQ